MIEKSLKDTDLGQIPQDWVIKAIRQLCSLHGRIGFRGYTKADLVKKGFGAISFSPSVIHNQVIDYSDCDYISFYKYEESPEIKVFNGDIIFCKTASIGKCAFIEGLTEKATINPQLVVINSFQCDPKFLYYKLIESGFQNRVLSITGGSTIPTMSQEKLYDLQMCVPVDNREQRRISEALSDIDKLIAALDKKIEKQKMIKQGVMQELLTGKRRLEGFSEPWIEKNLGKSTSIKARIGWQGLKTDEYQDAGSYSLITGTDFINGRIEWKQCHYVSKERYTQDHNIQIQKYDVLVTKDGTIGKVAFLDEIPGPGTLNSGIFVIRTKDSDISQRYLAKVFVSKYFDDFIDSIVAGSTIVHLYQKDIIKFNFRVPPTISEQEKICEVIESIDKQIVQLEMKHKKYANLKQGMMQQLLTGRIRLRYM